jgi:DNA-binding CsgD family transcriptional regulator
MIWMTILRITPSNAAHGNRPDSTLGAQPIMPGRCARHVRLCNATLLTARGRAHETLGAFQQAHDDFTAAYDVAHASGDQPSAWAALHALGMLWAARDYERAGQYRRDALALARTLDEPTITARSLNRVGNWYVNREDPQSGIPFHNEALAIFERAGDRRGVAETVDLLSTSHHIAGDEVAAARLSEHAIELFTALDDRRGLVNAFSVLVGSGPSHHASTAPVRTSRYAVDMLQHECAVRLASEIGWRAGEAFSRYLLADSLSWRGEYDRALKLAGESLLIAEELEHREWQCGARRVLGVLALSLCDTGEALAQLEAAHDIARRLGSATWIRWTGADYASALVQHGSVTDANALLDDIDCLVPAYTVDSQSCSGTGKTLGARALELARADVALARGDGALALYLVGDDVNGAPRAGVMRARALSSLQRWNEATAELSRARVEAQQQHAYPLQWRIDAAQGCIYLAQRRRLDARHAFDRARAIAQSLEATLNASNLAGFRAFVDRLAPPPPEPTSRQAAKQSFGGLTQRERDAAALIAAGKSNRDIAARLGIGERTVEGYVAAAMAKLRVTSRSQVAVWAAEQGLTPTVPAPQSVAARSRR